jgi:hypothetical protein
MIPVAVKQRLLENWGDKATALECNVEIKFHDVFGFEYYLLAINPDDHDEACVWAVCDKANIILPLKVCISELYESCDKDGEPIRIDHEFRPMRASDLIKKLRMPYDASRN